VVAAITPFNAPANLLVQKLAPALATDAATKIAAAAFDASGQQCISAQRIIVEQPVFGRFIEIFVAAVKKLKVGEPRDNATDVGR
jgi:glyceraldehyde-3-phosphate dehydrogenase (NADP+)